MLLAQVAIPAAIAMAILLATWLSFRSAPPRDAPPSLAAIAGTISESAIAYLHRQYPTIAVLSFLLAILAGGGLGLFRESVEDGALVGGAVLAGAVGSGLAGYLGARLTVRANLRAAASTGSRAAFHAGAVTAMLPAALALGSVTGLYALYSRVLDNPVEEAALAVAGVALGGAFVALVARPGAAIFAAANATGADASAPGLTIPSGDPRNAATIATQAARNLTTGLAVGLFETAAAALIAATVVGATVSSITGDIEWVLLPAVLSAAGLLVAAMALVAVPLWGRLTSAAALATLVAVSVVNAAAVGGISFALIEDEWHWFAAAGGAGVLGGLLLAAGSSGLRPGGSPTRTLETTGVFALVLAAVLIAGFALGRQAELPAVADSLAGMTGLATAVIALLMSLPVLAGLPAAAAVAANASTIISTDHDSQPEARDSASRFAAGAQSAAGLAHGVAPVAAGLAGLLLVVAFLVAVRQEFGSIAHTDPDRYATMAQDLDLLPPGEDHRLLAVIALESYAGRIEAAAPELAERPRHVLMLAGFEETTARLDALVEDDALTPAGADRLGRAGSPLPLPTLLPVSAWRVEVLAGALLGVVLVAAFASIALRAVARSSAAVAGDLRRQFSDEPGLVTGDVRPEYAATADLTVRSSFGHLALAAVLALMLPIAAGVAFRWAYGGDGNEGWLALTGFAIAATLTATFHSLSPGREDDPAPGGTTLSPVAGILPALIILPASVALVLAPFLL